MFRLQLLKAATASLAVADFAVYVQLTRPFLQNGAKGAFVSIFPFLVVDFCLDPLTLQSHFCLQSITAAMLFSCGKDNNSIHAK